MSVSMYWLTGWMMPSGTNSPPEEVFYPVHVSGLTFIRYAHSQNIENFGDILD
jgi:hypothetical protein